MALFSMAAFAEDWTGVVSDAKCGKAHADKLNEKCVAGCVKGGVAPVFVSANGDVLKIHNPDAVKDHLGHKVTISGKMMDGAVHIDKVKM